MLLRVLKEILVLNESLEANDGIRIEVGIMFVKVEQRLGALPKLDPRCQCDEKKTHPLRFIEVNRPSILLSLEKFLSSSTQQVRSISNRPARRRPI